MMRPGELQFKTDLYFLPFPVYMIFWLDFPADLMASDKFSDPVGFFIEKHTFILVSQVIDPEIKLLRPFFVYSKPSGSFARLP